jgi:hypothetical protein
MTYQALLDQLQGADTLGPSGLGLPLSLKPYSEALSKPWAYRTTFGRLRARPTRMSKPPLIGRWQTRCVSAHIARLRDRCQREVSALIETGEVDEACSVWLALAADQIDAGLAPPGPVSLFRVRDRLSDAKPQIASRYRAVEARLLWLTDPIAGLDALESGYRELAEAQDPWFPRAALWWAEAALVEEHFSDIEQGRERLLEAIAAADDEALTVRLRLVLADVSGGWTLIVPMEHAAGGNSRRAIRWPQHRTQTSETVDRMRA